MDSCHPTKGCIHTNDDGAKCNDDNACTTGESCWDGACTGGKQVNCKDGNVCTKDYCSPSKGCIHKDTEGNSCKDGNLCTLGDTCWGGECKPGKEISCDDGNECTADSCDPDKGCKHTNTKGNACDDGSACSTGDTCWDGACAGGKPIDCDDGNVCTKDFCSEKAGGCVHSATAGNSCDDGNPCTVNDTCWDATCKSGAPNTCDDDDSCTEDSCDPATGCNHEADLCCSEDGPTECGDSKLTTITFRYTGGNCDASDNDQTKDWCGNCCVNFMDPAMIIIRDGGDTVFSGTVALNGTFTVVADGTKFDSEMQAWIKTPGGKSEQDLKIHTSCSQPFKVGDVFGALTVEALTTLDGGNGTIDCDDGDDCTIDSCDPQTGCAHAPDPCCDEATECGDSNLTSITFEYTGGECDASDHDQQSGFSCGNCCVNSMDPAMIIITEKDNGVIFNETISLNDSFTIFSSGDKFRPWIQAWIKKPGGKSEQDLKIHTSCSQPFKVGDIHGGLTVTGLTTKDAPQCGGK